MNIILDTDSYKFTHHLQNPKGTTRKWSYIEARGGPFAQTMFFGLQPWLNKLEQWPITRGDIREAGEIVDLHIGEGLFNKADWDAIFDDYGGHLPIRIEAMPEGTVAPVGTPQVSVVNVDPRFPWLPAYIETSLLRAVWYPSTVATISYVARGIIAACATATSDRPHDVEFKLHDFGARGVSSKESAGLGGLAHLVNFKGTDTVEALMYARKHYGAGMAGYSIPAAEHSTITSWGKEREAEFVQHMVETFAAPGRLVAVVGDSWSIFNFTQNILGDKFKAQIARTGGTLVERPDSGDPVQVPIDVIKLLMKQHGHSINSKGCAVLPDYIRVIQGDGMDLTTIGEICRRLREEKIAIDNIAFGMGGGLLQKLDRDTLKYAMKTCAIEIDGIVHDVSKKPMTDATKASKAGIQTVPGGQLVYDCGIVTRHETLDLVRERAHPTNF